MSTDSNQPTPAPQPAPEGRSLRDFWTKNRAALLPLVVSLASALVGSVLTYFGVPPKVVEVIKEVLVTEDGSKFAPTQGWFRDPDQIADNLDEAKTLQFASTPAARAVLGDEDVYLWRAVRKAAKLPETAYPNVNQLSVGCCVGCGWKHSCDVVQATAISNGAAFEWKPVSVEVIYAGSRVEVGGGRISGDGSVGAWAAKWCKDYGIVSMEKHGATDLTTFSPSRARQWGARGRGVPDALEPLAKTHPVKSTALVRTAAEGKKALQQGYPIAVCSDQGFTMERDAQGRARPQGQWNHCMAIIGYRAAKDGRSEAFFILNSWGDQAHTGPVWPADAPVAGFWADANVVNRMLSQGDSFALSDVVGFPGRKVNLDWFVKAEPRRVREFDPKAAFALAW